MQIIGALAAAEGIGRRAAEFARMRPDGDRRLTQRRREAQGEAAAFSLRLCVSA